MGWAKSRFVLAVVCLAAAFFPRGLVAAAIQSVDFGSVSVHTASSTQTIQFTFSGLFAQPIIHLTGTGVPPPNLVIMPTSFDFGDHATGTVSQSATFTLTNTGGAFPSVRYLQSLSGKAFTWTAGTCDNTIPPNSSCTKQWRNSGDIPIPDDFDGDGKADLAVRRPWDQTWYVLKSSNPDTPAVLIWGNAGDQVPQ